MATIYGLSESDIRLVRDLLAFWKNRIKNTTGRPNNEFDLKEQQAPEFYVARTGAAGIGAFEGDTGTGTGTGTGSGTGSGSAGTVPYADCTIYQLHPTDKTLFTKSITKRVHNLGTSAIDGFTYIIVARDKFGIWWVVGVGSAAPDDGGDTTTGTGTGTGTVTPCEGVFFTDSKSWQEIDCIDGVLYRTTFTQDVTWEYLDGCVTVDEGPIVEGEVEEIGCCDCPEGTGTGTSECGCDCCADGVWSEFILVVAGIVPILTAGCCSLFDGTWVLKWRGIIGGLCCWTTDEVYDGDGDPDCIWSSGEGPAGYSEAMWSLTLGLNEGSTGNCLWTLKNRSGSVSWSANTIDATLGAAPQDPQPTFCEDGGTLSRFPTGIGENGCTGPTSLDLSPSGDYMECISA